MFRTPIITRSLLATSALVAVAAGANAQSYGGVSTSQVLTSATGLNQQFLSSATWQVANVPAVEISGTGAVVISVSTGGTVSSSAITGTIAVQANTGVTGVTINNSGTLVNSNANGVVVSSTATMAGGVTSVTLVVNNTGTISGSTTNGSIRAGGGNDTINNQGGTIRGLIDLGAGNNIVTINGGSVTGNITTAGGVDTFTLSNGGAVTGDVNLGAGNNIVNISGSTLTGGLTTGINDDTVNLATGTITSNVDLSDGNNTLNVSNSTISGSLTTGTGTDAVTLLNGKVSGTIDLGTGTDTLNISGTTAFSTFGAVSGAENVNVSATTVNLNHGLSGASTIRLANGSTVNVNSSFATAAAGTIISSGTLRIGAGNTVSAATVNLNGGILAIDVASATSAGRLIVGSAATGIGATSYTINLASTANFIASGTALTIVDGSASATLGANDLTSTQKGVHTFSLATGGGGQDIILTIGRVSTSTLTTDDDAKTIANVLDTLGNSVTGTLVNVQSAITAATSAAGVDAILESLTPGLDGIGATSVGIGQATAGQISNRLASLRTGVATGDALATRNLWVEGFGATSTQDENNGQDGYDSTGAGLTVGVDSDALIDGYNVGAAFTYGVGNVESDSGNNAETDINSYTASLYGSRVLDNGVFVNGQFALGMNNYEMERTVSSVGKAKGETDGLQTSLKGEVGRDFAHENWTLTPVVGAQYTYLDVDGYTETGAGAANLIVKPDALNAIDLTASARAAYTVALGDGSTLRPNVRAGVTTRVGDTNLDATSRFTSAATTFSTPSVEADRTSFNLGAGLLLGSASGVDVSADYDADVRSSYTGHTGKLKLRVAF
jgi:outer membrane autotransporter protein